MELRLDWRWLRLLGVRFCVSLVVSGLVGIELRGIGPWWPGLTGDILVGDGCKQFVLVV